MRAQLAGDTEYTDCISTEELDPSEYPDFDIKKSNSEAPVILELYGMQSTHSLPLLPRYTLTRSGSNR